MVDSYHLHPHPAGMALPRGRDESACKENRGLVDEPTLTRELVLDALLMALWGRKPQQRVPVHSDQGTHIGSEDWTRFC